LLKIQTPGIRRLCSPHSDGPKFSNHLPTLALRRNWGGQNKRVATRKRQG
jgi:hypothetical protein